MSWQAWRRFGFLMSLSLVVALIGQPRAGALIVAGLGAITALVGALQDREAGR